MLFFTSKYSWVSLCPVLAWTSHELTKQTNMAACWWATMSLFRFGCTWKSLNVRTSKQQNSWILQTNKETREKLNLNHNCLQEKANKIENTKHHAGERDFPWLHTMKKTTPWSAKFAVLFLKLLRNQAPCSLETVPLGVLPFRPILKVKLTSRVLKQTLLGKTQVAHLWEQCYEIWMQPGYECTSQRKTAKAFQQCIFHKQSFHNCVNFNWIAI